MARRKTGNPETPAASKAPPASAASGCAVTFIRPHTHAGRDYVPGETAVVRPSTRERLIQFGVIDETASLPK